MNASNLIEISVEAASSRKEPLSLQKKVSEIRNEYRFRREAYRTYNLNLQKPSQENTIKASTCLALNALISLRINSQINPAFLLQQRPCSQTRHFRAVSVI
jgi:hypothetical protein